MNDNVETHYSSSGGLAATIADKLQAAGKDLDKLATTDLGAVDEFHIRGRNATLELADGMELTDTSRVLDIGSGLGGPARTIAETCGCHVTGIDLTMAFCEAAEAMSGWVGLQGRVKFRQGDATALPFEDNEFDAAMTIHVAMNIAAKDEVYAHAHRVLKPGGVFAVYDVLQGEGGEVLFPVPWARETSISHLATPDEMRSLLTNAGFEILREHDSTEESQSWFEARAAQMAESGPPPVSFQIFLGEDFRAMTHNQVRNLTERRIRTVTFLCRA
jgi:ubiquinone/menaquinone biosynthesis C-methylase UbiE